MGTAIADTIALIIRTLGGLYLLAVLLRFLFQAVRADFYNPFSQAVVKVTNFPLKLFRRLIPGYRGLDFAALILALILEAVFAIILITLDGYPFSAIDLAALVGWSAIALVGFILNIYFYSLIISVIASWIAPYSGNPVLLLIHQLLEPIQSIFRRVIPPMGGLDLSPIFIFLAIQVLETLFVRSFRLPTQYLLGI